MRAKIAFFFQKNEDFGVKRGIHAAAIEKIRQWLYVLVLSIAGFFHRALHLTPFDTKIVRRVIGVQTFDTKIVHIGIEVQTCTKKYPPAADTSIRLIANSQQPITKTIAC